VERQFGKELLQVETTIKRVVFMVVLGVFVILTSIGGLVLYFLQAAEESVYVLELLTVALLLLPVLYFIWEAYRRRKLATILTLYDSGFVIERREKQASSMERYAFSDIKGIRVINQRSSSQDYDVKIGVNQASYSQGSLFHDDARIMRLNRNVTYIESEQLQQPAWDKKAVNRRLELAVELNNGEKILTDTLLTGLGRQKCELFFVALEREFSKYILNRENSEHLNDLNISFGAELELKKGVFIYRPEMQDEKSKKNVIHFPVKALWSVQAPQITDLSEVSLLKLMGMPNESEIAEELASVFENAGVSNESKVAKELGIIFVSLAMNINVLYAIAKINRERI